MALHNNKEIISKHGFTLVELSIVIIIIGFLIAGISAGSSLIKQATLSSSLSEFQLYQTAYNSFLNRYGEVPGDMKTASSYWPNGLCAETDSNCDGNGNGVVEAGYTSAADEVARAWKHLQLAGLISNSITIIPDTLVVLSPGINTPNSKINGAGYMVTGSLNISRAGFYVMGFGDNTQNWLYLGTPDKSVSHHTLNDSSLSPSDAFNIDAKADDGTVTNGQFAGAITGRLKAYGGENRQSNCTTVDHGNFYDLSIADVTCFIATELE